jgi:hypothetical protein
MSRPTINIRMPPDALIGVDHLDAAHVADDVVLDRTRLPPSRSRASAITCLGAQRADHVIGHVFPARAVITPERVGYVNPR